MLTLEGEGREGGKRSERRIEEEGREERRGVEKREQERFFFHLFIPQMTVKSRAGSGCTKKPGHLFRCPQRETGPSRCTVLRCLPRYVVKKYDQCIS